MPLLNRSFRRLRRLAKFEVEQKKTDERPTSNAQLPTFNIEDASLDLDYKNQFPLT